MRLAEERTTITAATSTTAAVRARPTTDDGKTDNKDNSTTDDGKTDGGDENTERKATEGLEFVFIDDETTQVMGYKGTDAEVYICLLYTSDAADD